MDKMAGIQAQFTAVRAKKKFRPASDRLNAPSAIPQDEIGLLSSAIERVHAAQIAPRSMAFMPTGEVLPAIDDLLRTLRTIETNHSGSLWRSQLIQVERPLTLAYLFFDIPEFQAELSVVRERLEEALRSGIGEDGFMDLRWWPQQRALFASWIRSLVMLQNLDVKSISKDARQRLVRLFRNIQRTAIEQDLALLTDDDVSRGYLRLMRLAARVLREEPQMRNHSAKAQFRQCGVASSLGQATIMQSRWRPQSPRLALHHAPGQARIHLWRSMSLLRGDCLPQVRRDGEQLPLDGAWEVCCWHCDDEIQLVDLEMKLRGGVTLSRTLALAVRDDFLFFSDAIVANAGCSWEYRLSLPLAAGVEAVRMPDSSEVALRRKDSISGRVLPLGGSEWRTNGGPLEFQVADGQLVAVGQGTGKTFFAPIFLEWKSNRVQRPVTWRQLTVAQNRVKVDRDKAVGYRVRSGDQQWLIYRAFDQSVPHSVLSKHLACEFYMGRIERDHSLTDLVHFA